MRGKASAAGLLIAVVAMLGSPAFGGLAHYWTFDSSAGDSVSGGFNGTLIGNATISQAAGEYLRGTGALKIAHDTATGDYCQINGAVIPTYNPTAFTITTWFKIDTALGTQPTDARMFLWETFPDWTSGAGVDAEFEAQWYINPSSNADASASLNDGAWHHMAVVYNRPAATAEFYLDGGIWGLPNATIPIGDLVQPSTGLNIGNHRAGDGTRNWKGYIDDFAVYHGTLDGFGVQGLYNGTYTPQTVPVTEGPAPPPPVPTGRPVAYWTFDNDYSSAVHNDFYQGIPHSEPYTSITKVAGEFKRGTGALKLDSGPASGNGTYVEIPKQVADVGRDHQVTVSAWYKYSDISGDGSDTRNFVYESSPQYNLSFGLRNEGGVRDAEWWFNTLASDTTGPVITPGEWNLVVMVLDLDTGRGQFYHNGQLRDDAIVTGTLPEMTGFRIGSHRTADGSRDFDGYIDDVAVYHGVLTAEGVAGLYNGTYTPLTVPVADSLAAYPEPEMLEAGCTLQHTYSFNNPSGIAFNPVDGNVYVGRRGVTGEDGLYQITPAGTITKVVDGDRPAGILVDPGDGDLFLSEDNGGVIYRTALGQNTRETWVSEFNNTVDDDPVGMAIVPDTYTGGLVAPGSALSVDRGSGGYEEVWVWSLDAAEGETTLVSDSDVADGVGNVFIDLADVAVDNTRIFVADAGASKLYQITGVDTVSELVTNQVINAPRSLVIDPKTGDLLVLGDSYQVLRVDTATGEVSVVIEHVGLSSTWANMDISQDGSMLYVADYVRDRVYAFHFAGQAFHAGDANGDGKVDDLDASILAANWQRTGGATWAQADFNNDGNVNDLDASILAANWQYGVGAAVPEPGTLALLLGAAVALLAWWRQGRC